MEKILIVDDVSGFSEYIMEPLKSNGYQVECTKHEDDAILAVNAKEFDLMISNLDLNEPKGIEVILATKEKDASIRIIVLAEHPSMSAELEAIRLGVDFYLDQSISVSVLDIYIQKILDEKKTEILLGPDDLVSQTENIVMIVDERKVFKGSEPIALSPKEFDVLKLLLGNKSKIMSRQDIVDAVWSCDNFLESSRIVDVHIQKLREKLNTFAIVTVRGTGYKWNE